MEANKEKIAEITEVIFYDKKKKKKKLLLYI